MSLSIRLEGLYKLQAALPSYAAGSTLVLGQALLDSVQWSAESPSQPGEAPAQRSGYLAASLYLYPLEGAGVRVGSHAPYAAWLEFGSSRMAARPWLRPALAQLRENCAPLMQTGFPHAGA